MGPRVPRRVDRLHQPPEMTAARRRVQMVRRPGSAERTLAVAGTPLAVPIATRRRAGTDGNVCSVSVDVPRPVSGLLALRRLVRERARARLPAGRWHSDGSAGGRRRPSLLTACLGAPPLRAGRGHDACVRRRVVLCSTEGGPRLAGLACTAADPSASSPSHQETPHECHWRYPPDFGLCRPAV